MSFGIITRLLTTLQLTRVTLVFGAIGDLWFTILYTRTDDRYSYLPVFNELSLSGALTAGACVSAGLFAFAASLNDVLDFRHDSAFSPERPIPAGKIRSSQAAVIAVGSLLVAVASAVPFGSGGLLLTILTAGAILFYDAAGKHVPTVGVLLAGLIHSAHMMIANVELAFTIPVWLIFTHTVVVACLVHRFEEKRPLLNRKSFVVIGIGWLAWSALILGMGANRGASGGFVPENFDFFTLVFPLIAVLGFAAVAVQKVKNVRRNVAAEKLKRYGSMWQSIYAATWLAGCGLWPEAFGMAVFAILGLLVMTILKEVNGLGTSPVGYRH